MRWRTSLQTILQMIDLQVVTMTWIADRETADATGLDHAEKIILSRFPCERVVAHRDRSNHAKEPASAVEKLNLTAGTEPAIGPDDTHMGRQASQHAGVKHKPDRVKTRRGLVRYPNFLKIIDFRLDMPIRHGIGVQTAL